MARTQPTNQIITDEQMEESLHLLANTIIDIGLAKGKMVETEAMLRHVKAVNMAFSVENAISGQERDAYASNEYKKAIQEFRDATVTYETLRAQRTHAELVISVWQSQNANMRAMRV